MMDAVKSILEHQQIIGPGTDAIVASCVVHQTQNDKILRIAAYIKYKVISLDKNKDIQHETVSAILKSDPKFLDDTWEKIIGKPYEQASQEEIAKGFKIAQDEAKKQYEKVEARYYKQVPSTGRN